MTVDFWDVGQGDCTVITRPDGKLTIIDVGPKNSPLLSWLRDCSPAQISDIVLTHNDSDHMGAMVALLADCAHRIDRIWVLRDGKRPQNQKSINDLLAALKRAHDNHGIHVAEPRQGMVLWTTGIPETRLSILFPSVFDSIGNQGRSNNGGAIVSLEHENGEAVIWPGDHTVEKTNEVNLHATVAMLTGPHHGAPEDCGRPNRRQFHEPIDDLSPKRVFIHVGSKNNYSHPNPRYLARLQNLGCIVSCSGLTRWCDRRVRDRQSGEHVINGAARLGLRRTTNGFACRGALRLEIDEQGFHEDENQEEHREAVRTLTHPHCISKSEWKRNR